MKKIIIFDVDGVIFDSWVKKIECIKKVLEKFGLLDLSWVREIIEKQYNRVKLLRLISEKHNFDLEAVLLEINKQLLIVESETSLIFDTHKFIEENYEKYDFFTNTSMPKAKLLELFSIKSLEKYFMEMLAYEDGSKRENIEYIMQVYNLAPRDILFIDDVWSNLDAVENTWVHTLLFAQDWVSLDEKINSIFK